MPLEFYDTAGGHACPFCGEPCTCDAQETGHCVHECPVEEEAPPTEPLAPNPKP
jgi:hypothetical protein